MLLLRPALGPARPGAQAAATTRRHVLDGAARGRPRLTLLRALLFDRPRGDLLGALGGRAALLLALLDVRVLPLLLNGPFLARHATTSWLLSTRNVPSLRTVMPASRAARCGRRSRPRTAA